ncbi:HSPB1-associated protein 1 [Centruroides vittatus]|uniref:HSPB1-associated protein 1 n=1 Tax=Centruroides vittatus TaxID=120091 RepID=UPI003510B2D5
MISAEVIKDLILNDPKQPFVLSNMIENWKCAKWTLKEWADICGKEEFKFRVSRKYPNKNECVWEGEADYITSTINGFLTWLNDSNEEVNLFSCFKRSEFWCYSSYNYMAKTFQSIPTIIHDVDWSSFGFPGRCGHQSTWWIGSEGAHTPCHQDTYGCNLVAQLTGRKLWVLFPPKDSEFLYPTRIPYEESSVFSSVNLKRINQKKHSKFQFSHPHPVILEPGEVLCVPPLWWHYVECLEPSISINTWIELETDDDKRLEEAITRMIMTGLIPIYEPENEDWLNPTESLVPTEETVGYVNNLIQKFNLKERENKLQGKEMKEEPSVKDGSKQLKNSIKYINSVSFQDYLKLIEEMAPENCLIRKK